MNLSNVDPEGLSIGLRSVSKKLLFTQFSDIMKSINANKYIDGKKPLIN